jgi:hypothetical protein
MEVHVKENISGIGQEKAFKTIMANVARNQKSNVVPIKSVPKIRRFYGLADFFRPARKVLKD